MFTFDFGTHLPSLLYTYKKTPRLTSIRLKNYELYLRKRAATLSFRHSL